MGNILSAQEVINHLLRRTQSQTMYQDVSCSQLATYELTVRVLLLFVCDKSDSKLIAKLAINIILYHSRSLSFSHSLTASRPTTKYPVYVYFHVMLTFLHLNSCLLDQKNVHIHPNFCIDCILCNFSKIPFESTMNRP